MDILIDTQSFIWFFEDNSRLPVSIKLYMENSNGLAVSIASFWEIIIKTSVGKLVILGNIADVMDKSLSMCVEIKKNYTNLVRKLIYLNI